MELREKHRALYGASTNAAPVLHLTDWGWAA